MKPREILECRKKAKTDAKKDVDSGAVVYLRTFNKPGYQYHYATAYNKYILELAEAGVLAEAAGTTIGYIKNKRS